MLRSLTMIRTATILLFVLIVAGCAAASDAGESPEDRPETTNAPPQASRELRVEEIAAGAPGRGPAEPRVIVAPSAQALSHEVDGEIPDRGEGTYLLCYWGQKPTGGYSLAVESARTEGERVTVRLALKEPPEDAILTQALTYPYVLAVVRGLDPQGEEFVIEDEKGEGLGWPVRRAGN